MGEGNELILLGWLRDEEARAKRARLDMMVHQQIAETAEAAAKYLRECLEAMKAPTP